MTTVSANLDKLLAFHKEHQDLKRQVVELKIQLKLSQAIIHLHKSHKSLSQDLEMANLIIDLSN